MAVIIEIITNDSVNTPAIDLEMKLYIIQSGELGREIALTRFAFSIPHEIVVRTIPIMGNRLITPSQVNATAAIETIEKNTIHQFDLPHFLSLFAKTTERSAAIQLSNAPVYAPSIRK